MSIFVGKTYSDLYEIYLKDNKSENNYVPFYNLINTNFLKKIEKFNPIFMVDAGSSLEKSCKDEALDIKFRKKEDVKDCVNYIIINLLFNKENILK